MKVKTGKTYYRGKEPGAVIDKVHVLDQTDQPVTKVMLRLNVLDGGQQHIWITFERGDQNLESLVEKLTKLVAGTP